MHTIERKYYIPVLLLLIPASVLAGWSVAVQPLDQNSLAFVELGILLVPFLFLRPQVGVLLLLVLLWLTDVYPQLGAGEFTLNRAIGVLVLGGLMTRRISLVSERGLKFSRFDALAGLLLIVSLLSMVTNFISDTGASQIQNYIMGFLIYWLMVNTFDSWRTLKIGAWLLIGTALVVALSAINEAIVNPVSGPLAAEARYGGEFFVNAVGEYAALGIMLLFWLTGDQAPAQKPVALFLAVVLATALFFSGNRSGVIALAVSALGIFLLTDRITQGVQILLVGIVLILVAQNIVVSVDPLAAERSFRLDALVDIFTGEDETSQEFAEPRRELIRASFGMFADYPILGVGFGNYGAFFPHYSGYDAETSEHNIFLSYLATTGGVGFAVLLLFYVEAFRALWQARLTAIRADSRRSATFMLAILFGFNVINALFHATYVRRQMFVIFGLAAVAVKLIEQEAAQAAEQHGEDLATSGEIELSASP